METQVVGAEDLERELARIRPRATDARAGLFGPSSKVWEVNREAVLFVGGARAALLQLAHPYVAEAIDQHSSTRSDPLGRFHRTFRQVFAMVWGDLEAAFGAARRVHRVHTHITGKLAESVGSWTAGSPYRANEPHALLWVHATLWETSVRVFEAAVRVLSPAEKECYYQETRLFGQLFGIEEKRLPSSWTDFERYNREMWHSPRLGVGRAAREIGAFLFEPPHPLLAPAMWWLRQMTAGLMPEPLRRDYGFLPGSRTQRATFAASVSALRAGWRWLPSRLRFVPPYLEARRRLRGEQGRDRIGELLQRLWLGRPS